MSPSRFEIERILQEFVDRRSRGESPSAEAYLAKYPDLADALRANFAVLDALDRCVLGRGALPPSETILGDYRIVRELGRGGMGVVFLATQISRERYVALKVLGAPSTHRYDTIERFRREAEIASRLHHPNLVTVYDVGERQGYCFFAMQYVEGITLARLLTRLREIGVDRLDGVDVGAIAAGLAGYPPSQGETEHSAQPLSPGVSRQLGYYGAVARLTAELADGLAYAHARGIIHRDVKPANILVSDGLVPQLADFGVARDVGQQTLSQTGDIVGTPYYMSPELAILGRYPVDHRTDIFSLGVTLFEMLALTIPFRGESSAEVLNKIALEPTPLPSRFNPQVPADLQTIALKALEKDPANRYSTASEMAEDLRRFLRFDPIRARMPGPLTLALRRVKRHRGFVATVAALAILGAALFVWNRRAEEENQIEELIALARLQESRGGDAEPAPWRLAQATWRQLADVSTGSRPEALEAIVRIDAQLDAARSRFRGELEAAEKNADASDVDRVRAVVAADALSRLDPTGDSPELRKKRNEILGIIPVRITSEPDGATVTAYRVDPKTAEIDRGSASRLGVTPTVDVSLPAGGHWIVVEKSGFGFGEYWLEVPRAEEARLHAALRSTNEAAADMVPVPEGRYRIGISLEPNGRPRYDEHLERDVEIRGFFIDRTEVSNERYASFVAATGHRPPPAWIRNGGKFPAGAEKLPVSQVRWDDARRYAEWAGKRLPTEIEWEVACRGPNSFLYPWGNEFVEGNAHAPAPLGSVHDVLVKLDPVDSRPDGRSPFGAHHMAGNVQEWVWDLWTGPVSSTPGSLGAGLLPGRRVVRGVWLNTPDGPNCWSTVRSAADPGFPTSFVGFRCAKSTRP